MMLGKYTSEANVMLALSLSLPPCMQQLVPDRHHLKNLRHYYDQYFRSVHTSGQGEWMKIPNIVRAPFIRNLIGLNLNSLLGSYLVDGCDGVVVVLDGVLDLREGVLGVVHAEGEAVEQVRVRRLEGGVQRGVAQREAAVVVADARRLL